MSVQLMCSHLSQLSHDMALWFSATVLLHILQISFPMYSLLDIFGNCEISCFLSLSSVGGVSALFLVLVVCSLFIFFVLHFLLLIFSEVLLSL